MSTLIIKYILQGSLIFPPVLHNYTEQVINIWQDSGNEKYAGVYFTVIMAGRDMEVKGG